MSELKIKDIASLNKLVDALCHNGYKLQIATVCKPWPHNGIDYFAVKVEDSFDSRLEEGEKG